MSDHERHTKCWVEHGGTVWVEWVLVGPLGAVSFNVRLGGGLETLPWGIDVHHKNHQPDREWYSPNPHCEWTGGECWSDGTALGARKLWERVIGAGSDEQNPDMEIVWGELAAYYEAHFNTKSNPLEAIAS